MRDSSNGGMDQQAKRHFQFIEKLQECRTEGFSHFPITSTYEQEKKSKKWFVD